MWLRKEAEFSNPIDVTIAVKGMAEMHKAQRGIGVTIKKSTWQEELLKISKTIRGIKIFKELALLHEYKSDLIKSFLLM